MSPLYKHSYGHQLAGRLFKQSMEKSSHNSTTIYGPAHILSKGNRDIMVIRDAFSNLYALSHLLESAIEYATYSDCKCAKVGCSLALPHKNVLRTMYVTAYNKCCTSDGLDQCSCDILKHDSAAKFACQGVHAEQMAIQKWCTAHAAFSPTFALCTKFPCANCFTSLINLGVRNIVLPYFTDDSLNAEVYGKWTKSIYNRLQNFPVSIFALKITKRK